MYAGETADQMVKMSLQGIEVVANISLQAGEIATRSLAAALYQVLTDQKKVKGKTRLENLLKDNKELSIFAIKEKDLKMFMEEAKKYGVLYCVITEKVNKTGIVEIMAKEEDKQKIDRIIDKLDIATIDTEAIKEAIQAQRNGKPTVIENVRPMTDSEKVKLYKDMGFLAEEPEKGAPQLEMNSTKLKDKFKRKSVREELKEIRREVEKNKINTRSRGKKKNKKKVR